MFGSGSLMRSAQSIDSNRNFEIKTFQMLALLEEMYHELGLVEELDIHPSTLKR